MASPDVPGVHRNDGISREDHHPSEAQDKVQQIQADTTGPIPRSIQDQPDPTLKITNGMGLGKQRSHNIGEDGSTTSADESTGILAAERGGGKGYHTSGESVHAESREPSARSARNGKQPAGSRDAEPKHRSRRWWSEMVEKYGSVELENKGSVARDHLAIERTFLAWLRTSLSFASIGIAITQLFSLNTTLGSGGTPAAQSLKHVGKPLGVTFIGISIIILLIGFHRYFESQHYVIRGKFPASRGGIVVVVFITGAVIAASLIVILALARGKFD